MILCQQNPSIFSTVSMTPSQVMIQDISYFLGLTIAKYTTGWLNNRALISHSSGDQKSKIRVSEALVSPEASVLGSLGPSMMLPVTSFHSFLWLSNIPLYICLRYRFWCVCVCCELTITIKQLTHPSPHIVTMCVCMHVHAHWEHFRSTFSANCKYLIQVISYGHHAVNVVSRTYPSYKRTPSPWPVCFF